MNIHGPGQIHGPHGINPPHNTRLTQPTRGSEPAQAPSDHLEISPAAEAAVRAAESGEVRHDLVARIRGEIAAGTYETSEKLDHAVERLLDEIG